MDRKQADVEIMEIALEIVEIRKMIQKTRAQRIPIYQNTIDELIKEQKRIEQLELDNRKIEHAKTEISRMKLKISELSRETGISVKCLIDSLNDVCKLK